MYWYSHFQLFKLLDTGKPWNKDMIMGAIALFLLGAIFKIWHNLITSNYISLTPLSKTNYSHYVHCNYTGCILRICDPHMLWDYSTSEWSLEPAFVSAEGILHDWKFGKSNLKGRVRTFLYSFLQSSIWIFQIKKIFGVDWQHQPLRVLRLTKSTGTCWFC